MTLVTCYDPDGNPHQKESIDAREACLHNGFTMALPGETAVVEYVPTMAELLAARDQMLERERALDEREQRLVEAENRVEALGAANDVEAQRLRDEAARMQAAKDAAAAPAPTASATTTEKPAKAAKA